jgi:hypothetical protein
MVLLSVWNAQLSCVLITYSKLVWVFYKWAQQS